MLDNTAKRHKDTKVVIDKQNASIPPSLTLLQYFAKVLVVASAVPPAVPELVLALPDAQPGSFGHLTDNLWLSLAQLSLLAGKTLRLPANAVGVHHQRTAHRPRKIETMLQKRRISKRHDNNTKVPTFLFGEQHLLT